MSAHIRWLFAVALLSSTYDARAAIDCTTPQGVLALMMAGAIESNTAHCVAGSGTSLNCSTLSKLFLVDQGHLNTECSLHVHMHLYYSTTADALADLPNLSTHPNWATPADVKVSSPSFFIRTNGSTNIYSSTTSFGRGSLSQGDTVFYRWGKEIIRSDAINPWVWSEVSSFVVPAPLPPRPPRPPPTSTSANTPNLLPALSTPVVLTRPIGPLIATTAGGMFRINDAFCGGLPPGIPAVVNVPNLTWGVAGVNIAAVTTGFDVQLIDATTNNPLDTLTLQNGFPANTPLVQRNNYPGRLTTIRVISNPTFQVKSSRHL